LVIDISRLRENRAANADANEVTILRPARTPRDAPPESIPELQAKDALTFPRLSVPIGGSRKSQRQLLFVGVVLAAVLLVGTMLAIRSRSTVSSAPVAVASPSPSVEPSPSPSPSPTPSAKRAVAKPTPEKKKGGFKNTVKRIFKNPF
jgi:hypothetical protein